MTSSMDFPKLYLNLAMRNLVTSNSMQKRKIDAETEDIIQRQNIFFDKSEDNIKSCSISLAERLECHNKFPHDFSLKKLIIFRKIRFEVLCACNYKIEHNIKALNSISNSSSC